MLRAVVRRPAATPPTAPRLLRLARASSAAAMLLDNSTSWYAHRQLPTGGSGVGAPDWVAQLDLAAARDWAAALPNRAPPRVLVLYGSLRRVSFSRCLAHEFARVLERLGADARVFDPAGLPQHDAERESGHAKVAELRGLSAWSEGHVWVSPEQHGAVTGVFKSQIDWLPLSLGSVRPTQGRTLAVAQVCGGSQSFNAVNTLRLLGRWMRMLTVPNQASVPEAWTRFDEAGRMRPGPHRDRVVDVAEELFKFTLLTRDHAPWLVDRFSEREEVKAEGRLLSQAEKAAGAAAGAAAAAAGAADVVAALPAAAVSALSAAVLPAVVVPSAAVPAAAADTAAPAMAAAAPKSGGDSGGSGGSGGGGGGVPS